MRGFVQFATSLPGAMLLTGFLMERFGVLQVFEQLALQFQKVSADFWALVFWIIPFRIDYDPNILSTYTLLIVPVIFEACRGKLIYEYAPKDWYYYFAGLAAVALVVTGYEAWGFFAGIYQAFGLILLTVLTIFVLYLPVNLIWLAFFGVMGMFVVNQCLSFIFGVILIVFWFLDANLADVVLSSGLPGWIKEPIANMINLYSWSTLASFFFALFTLMVLAAAPLTKAPLFVVAWVGVFFAASWFDTHVRPVLNDYLNGLSSAQIIRPDDAPVT